MAASLADLTTRVRRLVKDTDGSLWIDEEVTDAIADAIAGLWPDIYMRTVTSIGSTILSTYEYAVDAGIERIGRVEVRDADGRYVEVMEWEEEQVDFGESGSANGIVIQTAPRTAGNDIRVTYRGKFSGTVPDYPDYMDRAVILDAGGTLFESLLSERARFFKYSTALDKDATTPAELVAIIDHRHDRFDTLVDQFRMPPIASQRQRALGLTEGIQPAHSGRRRSSEAPGRVQ